MKIAVLISLNLHRAIVLKSIIYSTFSALIKFIPWVLLFISKCFFLSSLILEGPFLILNWQVGAIRGVATCALSDQAGLTLNRIKAAAVGARSSKSKFKRKKERDREGKREIHIKNT